MAIERWVSSGYVKVIAADVKDEEAPYGAIGSFAPCNQYFRPVTRPMEPPTHPKPVSLMHILASPNRS